MLLVAKKSEIGGIPLDDLELTRNVVRGLKWVRKSPPFATFAAAAERDADEHLFQRMSPVRAEQWRIRWALFVHKTVRALFTSQPLVILSGAPDRDIKAILYRRQQDGDIVTLARDIRGNIRQYSTAAYVACRELCVEGLLEGVPVELEFGGDDAEQSAPMRAIGSGLPALATSLQGLTADVRLRTPLRRILAERMLRPCADAYDADIAAFAGVNPKALRHARRKHRRVSATAVFFYGDASTDQALENRSQALRLFPAVEASLWHQGAEALTTDEVQMRIGDERVHRRAGLWAFLRATDSGEPVVEALRDVMGVPLWAVRAALHAPAKGVIALGGIDRAVHQLSRLSPDRVPRDDEEWDALAWAATGPLSSTLVASILKHGYGPARRAICSKEDLAAYTTWLESMAELAELPRRKLPEQMGHPTLREWEGLARAWRRAQRGALSLLGQVAAQEAWLPMVDGPLHIRGLDFVCLTTRAELADEGKRLRHCAGGYAARCALGMTHILSARKGVTSVATIAFEIDRDDAGGATARLSERTIRPGVHPVGKTGKAIQALCRGLRTGRYPLSGRMLVHHYPQVVIDHDDASLFQAAVAEARDAALALYRPALMLSPRRGLVAAANWQGPQRRSTADELASDQALAAAFASLRREPSEGGPAR